MRRLRRTRLERISPLEDVATRELPAMPTVETQVVGKEYKGFLTRRMKAIYSESEMIKRTFEVLKKRG